VHTKENLFFFYIFYRFRLQVIISLKTLTSWVSYTYLVYRKRRLQKHSPNITCDWTVFLHPSLHIHVRLIQNGDPLSKNYGYLNKKQWVLSEWKPKVKACSELWKANLSFVMSNYLSVHMEKYALTVRICMEFYI